LAGQPHTYYERYWDDEGFRPTGRAFPGLLSALDELVEPGSSWLDVGCGDALTAGPAVVERGGRYAGVDISGVAVDQARENGFDAQVVEDAGALPFDAGEFDGVICVEVFEHLFDPRGAAAEIHRIVRPGGALFATVPNAAYWRRRAELAVGRFDPIGDDLSVREPWRDPHIRFFTPTTFAAMLRLAGFDVRVSGMDGAFVRDWPKIGPRLASGSSRIYRALEHRAPGLFALRLRAIATKRY
jgi:SAM-dependent methyltransferase